MPTPKGKGRHVGTHFLTLSKTILNDFARGEDPEQFFKRRSDVVLQRITDPSVPWDAGRRYHILLVTMLVRELRENVLCGGLRQG